MIAVEVLHSETRLIRIKIEPCLDGKLGAPLWGPRRNHLCTTQGVRTFWASMKAHVRTPSGPLEYWSLWGPFGPQLVTSKINVYTRPAVVHICNDNNDPPYCPSVLICHGYHHGSFTFCRDAEWSDILTGRRAMQLTEGEQQLRKACAADEVRRLLRDGGEPCRLGLRGAEVPATWGTPHGR